MGGLLIWIGKRDEQGLAPRLRQQFYSDGSPVGGDLSGHTAGCEPGVGADVGFAISPPSRLHQPYLSRTSLSHFRPMQLPPRTDHAFGAGFSNCCSWRRISSRSGRFGAEYVRR